MLKSSYKLELLYSLRNSRHEEHSLHGLAALEVKLKRLFLSQ